MEDFARLAQIVPDAIRAGGLLHLVIFYGGPLAIGVVVGRIAFALARLLGIIATGCALLYLYGMLMESGGIVLPVALPQAWVAWGILTVASAKQRLLHI